MLIGINGPANRPPARGDGQRTRRGRSRRSAWARSAAERFNYVLQAAGVLYRHYREFGLDEEQAWSSAVADFSLDYAREVAALRQERKLARQDRE
ncbi:MAG: hypothetical protein LBK71_00040 [Verrucomicrobiales bacterium]|nr:hypothetical protein [Verrucomicrobiales bacterium]